MNKLTRWAALALCCGLAACSSDPATFISYSQKKTASGGVFDATQAPKRTDALALNYANSVEGIFRARSTGARYTREGSDTALAGLAAFSGAAESLTINASTLSAMGIAGSSILQLRNIFDAKGRSNACFEAAERIHAAIKDYGAHNLNDVSETHLTPNGWTLANVVQSNIDIVNKILNGHLPSPEALAQASEPMSDTGAMPQKTGSTPVNNIPAGALTPAMAARVQRAAERPVRTPKMVSVEEFKRVEKERDRLLADKTADIDFTGEVFGVKDDPSFTAAQKKSFYESIVTGAGLGGTVAADAGPLATFFQDHATADQKTALSNALLNAKKKLKP